jgi:hypothetical protein
MQIRPRTDGTTLPITDDRRSVRDFDVCCVPV